MPTYDLPYPPTVNSVWRNYRGKMVLSAKAEKYRQAVAALIGPRPPQLDGELCVTVSVWMPDRKRRDIDNLLKALLDALTHAGVWRDDSQVSALSIARCGVRRPGSVQVQITELDQ